MLVIGDSTRSVPTYSARHPDTKFDVIFIDGGHDYPIAFADLSNCMQLAHKDTIVLMDDTMFTNGWTGGNTIGPTRAWNEHLSANKITEIARKDYRHSRGMAWGKYNI
jgi:predicted O-methyltransferase YrrM